MGCDPIIGGVSGPVSWITSVAMRGAFVRHDEFEENNVASASQVPGWFSDLTGAGPFAGSVPTLVANVRGAVTWTLTAGPVALVAAKRRYQGVGGVQANGFAVAPFDTWVWIRWRMNSVKPTVANDYYASPGGLSELAAGNVEPANGFGLVFDRPTDQFVLRAWRAGVPINLALGLTWNNGATEYKTVCFRHTGAEIEAYTGDPRTGTGMSFIGVLTGAEIEPATALLPYYAHFEQRTLTAPNMSIDMDYWGWGSPGV